jgi:SAM-dependent methyltransferase
MSFGSAGTTLRLGARCPRCGAFERHRLLWLYLRRSTSFFKEQAQLLDVAPVFSLQRQLRRRLGNGYVSVDLFSPLAMIRSDLMQLPIRDATFDWIFCYSVLEAVEDDLAAMREMRRVLRSGGTAFIHVFVDRELQTTLHGAGIVDPGERTRLFGASYNQRRYGVDYADRLRSAGFLVKEIAAADIVTPNEADRFGIQNVPFLFACSRRD